MKNLILIGAGGHCVSCIDVIEKENKFKIFGLIDKKQFKNPYYKIVGNDKDLKKIFSKVQNALISLGQIEQFHLWKKLFSEAKKIGFKFPTIISPLAYVSKKAFVDEGTIVMHGAIINAGAKVGKNCIINSKALVEHDAKIRNNSHVSTRSTLNGGVIVGNNCFIGSHSVVKQSIKIREYIHAYKGMFQEAQIAIEQKLFQIY